VWGKTKNLEQLKIPPPAGSKYEGAGKAGKFSKDREKTDTASGERESEKNKKSDQWPLCE